MVNEWPQVFLIFDLNFTVLIFKKFEENFYNSLNLNYLHQTNLYFILKIIIKVGRKQLLQGKFISKSKIRTVTFTNFSFLNFKI